MHIVIIGMGEVGRHLAKTLSLAGHSIRAVDRDAEALELATEHADIQVLQGHGSALATLRSAGAERSDLVVAVTDSDEVNLLAAVTSKHLGARQAIARVADRAYYDDEEGGFAHNVVGVDLLLNPQVLAAMEVHRVIRSFGIIEARNLADNRVEVVDVPVTEQTRFLGRQLREIAVPKQALVAGIVRGDELLIPHGGDHVELGDHLWLLGDIDVIPKMLKMFGGEQGRRRQRIMIVGGGEIGLAVARRLERDGVQVVLIERDLARCRELAVELKDSLVLHGDGTNRALLVEEDVRSCDGLLTLTRDDEVNIMAGLLGRNLGVRRTIALVHRGDYVETAREVGLDVAISPRRSAADYILTHVRSRHVSRVVQMEGGRGEILEIKVPHRARILGRTLTYVDFPKGALIGCVVRDKRVFVPRGADEILPDDVVVVFAQPEVSAQVIRLFRDPRA
jgi:trk system potassium uptake protein